MKMTPNQKAYSKEIKRVLRILSQLKREGYEFSKSFVPEMPKRVTKHQLELIRRVKPKHLKEYHDTEVLDYPPKDKHSPRSKSTYGYTKTGYRRGRNDFETFSDYLKGQKGKRGGWHGGKRKWTDEQRRAQSDRMKEFWKNRTGGGQPRTYKVSDQTRKKISESLKKKYQAGYKPPKSAWSEERKKAQSERMKKRWEDFRKQKEEPEEGISTYNADDVNDIGDVFEDRKIPVPSAREHFEKVKQEVDDNTEDNVDDIFETKDEGKSTSDYTREKEKRFEDIRNEFTAEQEQDIPYESTAVFDNLMDAITQIININPNTGEFLMDTILKIADTGSGIDMSFLDDMTMIQRNSLDRFLGALASYKIRRGTDYGWSPESVMGGIDRFLDSLLPYYKKKLGITNKRDQQWRDIRKSFRKDAKRAVYSDFAVNQSIPLGIPRHFEKEFSYGKERDKEFRHQYHRERIENGEVDEEDAED